MAKPSSSTNRRQLLIGAGALAATGAVGLDATLWSEPDPAYLLYLRAVRSEAAINNFRGDEEGDEYKALFDTHIATERELATTPATSLMGVWGKMKRLADDQYWAPDDYCLESCLGLSVLADLNRMVAANFPGWSGDGQDRGGES